ncbi:hypothetical protein APX70_06551 [Pseudomonas syringae pv. maculicola]|uniref:Uncharacterized protein n=1 Tax=Pseudomonas syringae pv. maculicola TaxID=59511 RepID=A0A3M2ZIC8_PSEYM|nr:hypothetical protein APX70_06551 [Pseudomonas syringae pv. maculicola]
MRQQADGNGRGVGSQNGVFTDVGFDFSEYGLFDLGVFDNRFNHQVDIAEIAVGQRRTNRV